jgi:predicted acylesterase/phospholipase RssA
MRQRKQDKNANAEILVSPTRYCDVVMKGGVTSGIVYPLAVCELAQQYRFVNIGGTSAGAIAAAITAAAEYRRANGDVRGFTEFVRDLPQTLGARRQDGTTMLFSLFQPNSSTRKIFDVLVGMIRGGKLSRFLRC